MKCKNCKWLQDEVCVNSSSLMCCEFMTDDESCDKFEKKVEDK